LNVRTLGPALLVVVVLSSCSFASQPSQAENHAQAGRTPAPSLTAPPKPAPLVESRYVYPLGLTVPIPAGWALEVPQGSIVLRPAPGGEQGFVGRLAAWRTPSEAASGFCSHREAPQQVGADVTVAGHAGAYQYFCPPSANPHLPGFWNVFLPTPSGRHTWHWDYGGAAGVGKGPYAAEFLSVLTAFAVPDPATK
jgi:hypothetical protein